MISAKEGPGVTASTESPDPPPRGVGPEIRLWHLDNAPTFAVEFVATGDLYVVDRETATKMIKRANRWTLNRDG